MHKKRFAKHDISKNSEMVALQLWLLLRLILIIPQESNIAGTIRDSKTKRKGIFRQLLKVVSKKVVLSLQDKGDIP